MIAQEIQRRLQMLGDPQRAQVLQRFFKTRPGEYGEGDVFVGLRVPELRGLAREYQSLALAETIRLLQSPIHEARLLALLILIRIYTRGDAFLQERIYRAYLLNTRFINNWDLVDASAEHIVGAHLTNGSRGRLHDLAVSNLLWERRIAIMATFHFIKRGEFSDTLHIARLLLQDPEDLIHKAVGWMLREIGKRDHPTEVSFLSAHYKNMPRTMLRYAIEKFPEELRQQYLRGEI
jgi:3-methyladenine DNA glycosylase AlkD